MRFVLALFARSGDWNGERMKRYALGGLFIAAVALPAWGALPGGGDGGDVGTGEPQGGEWSLPLQRSLKDRLPAEGSGGWEQSCP
jgi:hypothetical protein